MPISSQGGACTSPDMTFSSYTYCSAVMATPPMVRATPTSGLPVGTEDSACSSLSPSMLEAPTSAVATVMTRTPSHWLGLGLELGLGLG